jgi:hypothetical protein
LRGTLSVEQHSSNTFSIEFPSNKGPGDLRGVRGRYLNNLDLNDNEKFEDIMEDDEYIISSIYIRASDTTASERYYVEHTGPPPMHRREAFLVDLKKYREKFPENLACLLQIRGWWYRIPHSRLSGGATLGGDGVDTTMASMPGANFFVARPTYSPIYGGGPFVYSPYPPDAVFLEDPVCSPLDVEVRATLYTRGDIRDPYYGENGPDGEEGYNLYDEVDPAAKTTAQRWGSTVTKVVTISEVRAIDVTIDEDSGGQVIPIIWDKKSGGVTIKPASVL